MKYMCENIFFFLSEGKMFFKIEEIKLKVYVLNLGVKIFLFQK